MTKKTTVGELTVLVIDDNQQAVRLLAMMLRDMGVGAVVTAGNGAAGLKAVEEAGRGGIDAIICDWNMPEMTGIELLRRLRASSDPTPFIMITGKDTVESTIEAAKAGVTYYLPKPFGPDKLEQKVLLATGILKLVDDKPRIT